MTKPNFDIDAALKQLREGKDLTGKDGILTPLIKQLTEAAMQAELEEHLSDKEQPSRKNGVSSKTVKSPAGSFELNTPRDRAGTFEPQLVKKHQTHLTDLLARRSTPFSASMLRVKKSCLAFTCPNRKVRITG